VLVSPRLGDASELVHRAGAGCVVGLDGRVVGGRGERPALGPVPLEEKRRLHALALERFTKAAHAEAYRRLVG